MNASAEDVGIIPDWETAGWNCIHTYPYFKLAFLCAFPLAEGIGAVSQMSKQRKATFLHFRFDMYKLCIISKYF